MMSPIGHTQDVGRLCVSKCPNRRVPVRKPMAIMPSRQTGQRRVRHWGTHTLNDEQRLDLLEIFEERYRRKSTLITVQLPVAQWHDMISEPTIADAFLDRIIQPTYRP